jgi:hypothetical protein
MTDFSALPQWKCHKIVRAARIHAIGAPDGDNVHVCVALTDEVETRRGHEFWKHTHSFLIPKAVYARMPENAAYIVIYDDGYISFSPAKAFEEGYIRLTKIVDLLVPDAGEYAGRSTLPTKDELAAAIERDFP